MERAERDWNTLRKDRQSRLAAAGKFLVQGKFIRQENTIALLEEVIKPYDKVAIEGDNQKQADFLSECLTAVDVGKVHDLHILQSTISLPEHVEIFEKGIAKNWIFRMPELKVNGWLRYCRQRLWNLGPYIHIWSSMQDIL